MRTIVCITFFALLATAYQPDAGAWNALGHKVIAEIAWQRLKPEQRAEIVGILRRHPRFDDDFAKRLGDDDDESRMIFLHAATWPDIARSIRGPDRSTFDRGTWHYVKFPLLLDGTRPAKLNLATGPPRGDSKSWNVAQAARYSLATIEGNASPQAKALAYCWLFHLVGDMHQPMHSTALFCERFPAGDRGGNSIPLRQSGNLHSLWDNLLGRRHRLNDVRREAFQLAQLKDAWNVDTTTDIADWIAESHELAKTFAYDPVILEAVRQPGELQTIDLPEEYLKAAGEHAQRRVIAAGVRLAALLGAEPSREPYRPAAESALSADVPLAKTERSASPTPKTQYWLNTNGNVRHNATCRWFGTTKRGHYCGPDEGTPCGECGG